MEVEKTSFLKTGLSGLLKAVLTITMFKKNLIIINFTFVSADENNL